MKNSLNPLIEDYKVDAFDAINFTLVREKKDLKNGESFHPEMAYQIFGASEKIFGYKDLKVNVAIMAGSLSTYVNIGYSQKISPHLSKGVEADDILKEMKKVYDQELHTSESDFFDYFDEELRFKPFGTLKAGYTVNKDGQSREFAIFYVDEESADFKEFIEYHKRMETFIAYYINGASFISIDDKWGFYVLFEKYCSPSCPEKRYAFVGFMTAYKFYAFPEHIRPRVSQILVLPPFRGMGHGTRLLETLYDDLVPLPKVVDITVEGPSEEFQRIRDLLDSKRCLQLAECMSKLPPMKLLANAHEEGSDKRKLETPEEDANGETSCPAPKRRRTAATVPSVNPATPFVNAARGSLKLCRGQAHRIYDILCLYQLPRDNESLLTKFRDALLQRAKAANNRLRLDSTQSTETVAVAVSAHKDAETAFMSQLLNEQYQKELEEEVDSRLEAYLAVVAKLDSEAVDSNVSGKSP